MRPAEGGDSFVIGAVGLADLGVETTTQSLAVGLALQSVESLGGFAKGRMLNVVLYEIEPLLGGAFGVFPKHEFGLPRDTVVLLSAPNGLRSDVLRASACG